MSEFDPATHRMVPQQRWFEDFSLHERFVIPSRTHTSAVFPAFQTASMATASPNTAAPAACRTCWRTVSRR